ncbi:hypothetical protein [Bradyrhizobium sp. BWC-3-1]|uniref:hypothetical protein n=1 Tax=Bradyrhizobium sp. BWC-3-1 TaxID=3080012 RepID=UPI00293EFD62|nr:hypothetical protein [Bradyrhizobium sp. BWC-3-1]WOH61926.1 hypothetical protein RX329_18265 [Bradyrhizobium sp. BWC-3-1]
MKSLQQPKGFMDTKLKEAAGRVRDYLGATANYLPRSTNISRIVSPGGDEYMLDVADVLALVDAVEAQRRQVQALNEAGFKATAQLCAIGSVCELSGHDVIRRDHVMDAVVEWRKAVDQANGAPMLWNHAAPVFSNDGQEPDWKEYAKAEAEEAIHQATQSEVLEWIKRVCQQVKDDRLERYRTGVDEKFFTFTLNEMLHLLPILSTYGKPGQARTMDADGGPNYLEPEELRDQVRTLSGALETIRQTLKSVGAA